MKNLLLLSLIGIFAFAGCQQSKSAKTIENLKTAIKSETSLSAVYAAFAKKAQQNHPAVAKFFEAASVADSIHAANLRKVLKHYGKKMEEFTNEIEVKNTLENLQTAIKRERENVDIMYTGFITDANEDKAEKAIQSFTWAHDTEMKRLDLFYKAISDVFKRIENSATFSSILPADYAVCPVCGNIFDNAAIDDNCKFCKTNKDKFIAI